MPNIDGIITEDVAATITADQTVFDKAGKKLGTVDAVDRKTGYMMVKLAPFTDKGEPFADKDLSIPFRLITTVDPRELYLSLSTEELLRDYANPPARTTVVTELGGEEIATTTEASGYTGAPIEVAQVGIDQMKKLIAVGDHVYTTEMTDLGTIRQFDPVTGWILIQKSGLGNQRDLIIPVTVVQDVNNDVHEVYLAISSADVERMKHLEPADVVFVQATARANS